MGNKQTPKSAVSKEPRIGDIVQVKDSSPRGTWRVGNVIEITESQDGKERAAKVMMPNENILQRYIMHLYHLECNGEEQSNETTNKLNSNQKVNCKGEEL